MHRVPGDAEFTVNFGFTLRDDHSKYCIFKIDVVFPKMDLKGEIVGTFDLEKTVGSIGYEPVAVPFDTEAVKSAAWLLVDNTGKGCGI